MADKWFLHNLLLPTYPQSPKGSFLSALFQMKKAAQIVADGRLFACDVGRFNDDVFVYIAAFGIFTEVSYGTPQEMKVSHQDTQS